MFKTVVELEELIPEEEKDEMFGIFKKNPSLLRILPGIEPRFQTFLKKVENLCPHHKANEKRGTKRPMKTMARNVKDNKKLKPTENDLKDRLYDWFLKELPKRGKGITIKEAMVSFTLKENPNGSFTFNCLKCKSPCIIPNAEPTKISISNATRHITKHCWLNESKKKKSNTDSADQQTVSSYFSAVQKKVTKKPYIFVPCNTNAHDFTLESSTIIKHATEGKSRLS